MKALVTLLVCFCLGSCFFSFGQAVVSVKGFIASKNDRLPILGAIIQVKLDQIIVAYSLSDSQGEYTISNLKPQPGLSFTIEVRHIGYLGDTSVVHLYDSSRIIRHNVLLLPDSKSLPEVRLSSTIPVLEKADTIEYNAEAYKTKETRKVEDLLKNIDGFSIGSDGKITYRGKPVKALLIDGDDLAKSEYGLVSKNLTSEIIDKIQVIDDYHENRLMKGIIPSDEVAVNLKIKGKFAGKVTGAATVGLGVKGRYFADGNIIWLKNFKMMQIGKLNNVSDRSVYEQSQESIDGQWSRYNVATSVADMASGIFSPSLPLTYTLNARLTGTHTIFSKKISRYVNLNTLLSFASEDAGNFQNSVSHVFVDNQQNWDLANRKEVERNSENALLSISLAHDRLKKSTGTFELQVRPAWRSQFFTNVSSLAITDSMKEHYKSFKWPMTLSYTRSTKLAKQKLFSLSVFGGISAGTYQTGIFSSQFDDVFQLRPASELNQLSKYQFHFFGMEAGIIQKSGKLTYKWGMGGKQQLVDLTNGLTEFFQTSDKRSVLLRENDLQTRDIYLLGTILYQFNERLFFGTKTKIGYEIGHLNTGRQDELIWDINTDIAYELKRNASLLFRFSTFKKFPPLQYFYNDSTIQGNTSLYLPVSAFSVLRSDQLMATFSSFRIRENRSLTMSGWYKRSPREYMLSPIYHPGVSVLQYVPQIGNREAGALFSAKTFFYRLKGTASVSAFFSKEWQRTRINNQDVDQRLTNYNYSVSWVTSFRLPINWECTFGNGYFVGNQPGAGVGHKVKNVTTEVKLKSRLQFSEDFYMGCQYNYLKTSLSGFHFADIFSTYLISERISVDLKVHNLFNVENYETRWAALNVNTYQYFQVMRRYALLKLNFSFN